MQIEEQSWNQKVDHQNGNQQVGMEETAPSTKISSPFKYDIETMEQKINVLATGSIPNKFDALVYLKDIISSQNEEAQQVTNQRANEVIGSLTAILNQMFEKPKSEIPLKFVTALLTTVVHICEIKKFMQVIF